MSGDLPEPAPSRTTSRGAGTTRRTTIVDVARRAGVSPSAVSIVLNGRKGVGAQVRQRVLSVAEELGWQPNAHARALSTAQSSAVGLVFSRPPALLGADPFFPTFLAGVETVLARRSYALTLQVIHGDVQAEKEGYRRLARSGHVDGVFLLDLRQGDSRFELLNELGLPGLAVGHPVGPCSVPWLAPDDTEPIATAVQHLLAQGHERIAHVAGSAHYVHTIRRQRAWRLAMREAGLPAGPCEKGEFTGDGGASATFRLLTARDRPTAIIYANDLMAAAGMTVASELGLAVPGDLSIVGFDDVTLAAHLVPALTTIRQDVMGWGEAAAATLLAMVENEPLPRTQIGPSQFVPRASTGQAPARVRAAAATGSAGRAVAGLRPDGSGPGSAR
ncbi:MAG: LacI family DNA-binding transcriptional regulator [Streptosporangiaceae bacterium]